MYNRKDHYYRKAKEEGRASRASYKLEQIQVKFKIIKKGDVVLDLGCAPGGWLEVVSDMVRPKGMVIGIDLLPIKIQLKPNVRYIQGDINEPSILDQSIVFDVILSDMAPNTSGVAFKDAYLSYELCVSAFTIAEKLLKSGGNFVTKIFQGEEANDFRKLLMTSFKRVESYIPPATRQTSRELYFVAMGYKKRPA